MIITKKELNLIASTPQNECWICENIIKHIYTNLSDKKEISEIYLRNNFDIREHLRQIINK